MSGPLLIAAYTGTINTIHKHTTLTDPPTVCRAGTVGIGATVYTKMEKMTHYCNKRSNTYLASLEDQLVSVEVLYQSMGILEHYQEEE